MPPPLSEEMRRALRETVRGTHVSAKRATLAALIARGLADHTGALTHEGWKQAIAMLPLEEQCQIMGITIEKIHGLKVGDYPEYAAWRYFSSHGYSGAYCEAGPVLLLIRAAALDVLARLNTLNSRQDACSRFTEAQLTIHERHSDIILAAIRSANKTQVVCNFNEIYASLAVQEYYSGLTAKVMGSLFMALGSERLALITAAIMEAPYIYRAGWPDLTMTNEQQMLWAEVKTTDRLHLSQISTLHRMKPLLPGCVKVVQLV